MTTKITNTRTATPEEWRRLATNVPEERRAAFLKGEMPAYDDAAGTKRILPPAGIVTRDVPPEAMVTRAAPTRPIADLAAELRDVGAEPEPEHADDDADDLDSLFGPGTTEYMARGEQLAREPAASPPATVDRDALARIEEEFRSAGTDDDGERTRTRASGSTVDLDDLVAELKGA